MPRRNSGARRFEPAGFDVIAFLVRFAHRKGLARQHAFANHPAQQRRLVECRQQQPGAARRLRQTGERVTVTYILDEDEHLRRDTTLEGLAKLKPVFKEGGRVTAGNSSPLSDGAAAVIVMEAGKAAQLGLKPLARFVDFSVAGVRPEIMGVAPIAAIPKLLKRQGMTLDDIDLIELNEAFASQSLAVIRHLEMNPERVNVNGGAIALGHPLGCTGSKLTVQLINEMRRRESKYGMVTMCIGGGMGAAGLFEVL